jgi:hypothetical protein
MTWNERRSVFVVLVLCLLCLAVLSAVPGLHIYRHHIAVADFHGKKESKACHFLCELIDGPEIISIRLPRVTSLFTRAVFYLGPCLSLVSKAHTQRGPPYLA